MQIVFLSGKINGNDNYKSDFDKAEEFLNKNGYTVVNPARIDEVSWVLTEEYFAKVCYTLIDISEAIFMVSGWQNSKEANAQLTYAKSLGKKVMYQDYYAPFRKGQLAIIPNVGDESIIDDAPFRKVVESEEN